jgi:SepF-like predicted cell division protein (DUF552 family)
VFIKMIKYQELKSGLKMTPSQRSKAFPIIDLYASAATNLYGIISYADFTEISNQLRQGQPHTDSVYVMPYDITEEDALDLVWSEEVDEESVFSVRINNTPYLVSRGLTNIWNDDPVDIVSIMTLLRIRKDIPRFQPELYEFLEYMDLFVHEKTVEEEALKEYLKKYVVKADIENFDDDEELYDEVSDAAENLLIDIVNKIKLSDPEMKDIIQIIRSAQPHGTRTAFKIIKEDKKELTALVMDIARNTRRWEYNGHTSAELEVLGYDCTSGILH